LGLTGGIGQLLIFFRPGKSETRATAL
jgi:hypothetical protein